MIDFGRFLENWSIFGENLDTGVFRGAKSMAVFFFRENRYLGSNRSIRHCEAIGFDRTFETWSIFDETLDMGVFEGAETNGGVRLF